MLEKMWYFGLTSYALLASAMNVLQPHSTLC